MKRGLDKLTKEHRSWNMSRIRGKDTEPEMIVRRLLHKMGFRFRLHIRIPIEVGRVAPRAPRVGVRSDAPYPSLNPQLSTKNQIRPSRHRSAQIQNRHLRSRHCGRALAPSAQRLQELHNPNASSEIFKPSLRHFFAFGLKKRFACPQYFRYILDMIGKETSVLDRLLEPLSRCFTPESAQALVKLRADSTARKRIAELAEKCNEGRLSLEEQREYETYVHVGNLIAILQAKARLHLKRHPA